MVICKGGSAHYINCPLGEHDNVSCTELLVQVLTEHYFNAETFKGNSNLGLTCDLNPVFLPINNSAGLRPHQGKGVALYFSRAK